MGVEPVSPASLERLLALERRFAKEGLTFDDVLLVPAESAVLPDEVSTRTRLTPTISLNIPVISAAMDTVTEARMAIALAREGGVGVIHRNLSVADQVEEVDKVKRSESGMIVEPVTLRPEEPVSDAMELMAKYHISGVPITDESGQLVGILTNRDLRFESETDRPIASLMTSRNLVTVPVGTTLDEAREVLRRHKIEKLPVVNADGFLKGLITVKDIQKRIQFPVATKDEQGRLRVGAAIGTGADAEERASALIEEDVDFLVVDTSHGHSRGVIETVRRIRSASDVPLIAGNIATAKAAMALIDAGADAIKVGIGPGSICTTRVVAGVGVPQVTAIYDCAEAAAQYEIPLIADGGMQFSGDLRQGNLPPAPTPRCSAASSPVPTRALGMWCSFHGERVKEYRGMGSVGAMKARSVFKRSLLPRRRRRLGQARPRGDRGPSCIQGPTHQRPPPTHRGPSAGHGLLRRVSDRHDEDGHRVRENDGSRPARKSSSRHCDHEPIAQLRGSLTACWFQARQSWGRVANVIPLPTPEPRPEDRPVLVVDLGGQYLPTDRPADPRMPRLLRARSPHDLA